MISRDPIAHFERAQSLAAAGDLAAAGAEFERTLELSPTLAVAHRRYAELLTRQGDVAGALEHIAAGYKPTPAITVPYTGDGTPIRVLQFGSSIAGGHLNTDAFLDARRFEVTTVVVEYWDPAREFPAHDIVVNSIADADLCESSLYIAQSLSALTMAPVVNPPMRVLDTGRASNSRRLQGMVDVIVPHIELFPRTELVGADAGAMLRTRGFSFPLLVRSPGHQMGEHFAKIDSPEALGPAIAALPGDELFVLEFVDVRASDGSIRKYRAVVVEGNVYPAHLAVSDSWKIHYFSATRVGDEERAEEARYLQSPRAALGDNVVDGLEAVARALGLNYLGIDFGVDANGQAVIFEANASMTTFLPEDNAASHYRRAPVLAIYEAAREMIVAHCRP